MKTVGIETSSYTPGYRRMFDALGRALGLSFEKRSFGDDRNIEAWIVLGADRQVVSRISQADRPCYVVIRDDELAPCGNSPTIAFSGHPALAAILRGRRITADEAAALNALPNWLDDVTVL